VTIVRHPTIEDAGHEQGALGASLGHMDNELCDSKACGREEDLKACRAACLDDSALSAAFMAAAYGSLVSLLPLISSIFSKNVAGVLHHMSVAHSFTVKQLKGGIPNFLDGG